MITASITELKNRLSSYVDKVRAGESVLVLDRGLPVARLESPGIVPDDERVAALVRQGLARPATAPPPVDLLREELPAKRNVSLLEALLEERREGR